MTFGRLLLVWVCAAAAGCAHDGLTDASVAGSEAPRPWFCQADTAGSVWRCGHDEQADNSAKRRTQQEHPAEDHGVEARGVPDAVPLQSEPAVPPRQAPESSDMPPDGFVVQLLAVSSKRAVESLAAELRVPGLSAARIERDGQLFYVLLYGVYPDRDAAESAGAARPEALQRFEPWVRRMSSLQAAMQRGNVLAASLGAAE